MLGDRIFQKNWWGTEKFGGESFSIPPPCTENSVFIRKTKTTFISQRNVGSRCDSNIGVETKPIPQNTQMSTSSMGDAVVGCIRDHRSSIQHDASRSRCTPLVERGNHHRGDVPIRSIARHVEAWFRRWGGREVHNLLSCRSPGSERCFRAGGFRLEPCKICLLLSRFCTR